jgi:hypothetical protein
LRFWNNEVFENIERVMAVILRTVDEQPHPLPDPPLLKNCLYITSPPAYSHAKPRKKTCSHAKLRRDWRGFFSREGAKARRKARRSSLHQRGRAGEGVVDSARCVQKGEGRKSRKTR